MGRFFEHSDIEQRTIERHGTISGVEVGSTQQSQVNKMREDMRERYGWLSPSQYYSGQYDSQFIPNELFISLTDIEKYRKGTGELPTEAADRTEIPHYFWIDSLSNWCYFKITDDMTAFKKTTSRFGKAGNALLNIAFLGLPGAIDAMQRGSWWNFFTSWSYNLALSYADLSTTTIEGIDQIESFISDNIFGFEEELFGTSVLKNMYSRMNSEKLTLGAMMLGAASELMSPGMSAAVGILWGWIQSAYDLATSDVDAEPYIEELASGSKLHNLPRNCISLYMWNGYKRNWMPVKQLIEIYDRYCKRSSYDLVYTTVKNFYALLITTGEDDILDKFLETIGLPINTEDETIENFRQRANDIRDAYGSSENLFCSKFTHLIMEIPQGINYCSRFLFINIYGIDPDCIEAIQARSPLSKKQTLYNWDTDRGSWSQKKWQENMSFWIALPNDSAKLKLYAIDTYQLINRPTAYKYWFNRDLKGYLHKNIGHPCFMRGNDDVLWMCYWLRWSSSRGAEKSSGSLLTEKITVEGLQDIMKLDVDNWERIVDSMFQKHDEYGFEDWLINGNYLLSYSKFTIDEEQPSEVLSFEDATLAPNKAELVNSIDDYDGETLTLSLSSGTVVSRDDGNEYIDTAKRWR